LVFTMPMGCLPLLRLSSLAEIKINVVRPRAGRIGPTRRLAMT
jgi:hypothetical protein